MTDFSVRSDNVDVEQIMGQIRARIREKRGVDYTEDEIRELAKVKLEKFLDPRGVRSDLLTQFRKTKAAMPPAPSYTFEDTSLFESHRGFLRFMRKLLKPILMLFFNVNRLSHALHIQAQLNTRAAQREELDALHYELMHNLVLETTRLGIEVKNLKMRLESMSSRLDFDERRARALEGVVQYRPGAVPPLQPPTGSAGVGGGERPLTEAEQAERRSRRRRRRGRRRPGEGGGGQETRNGAAGSVGAREESPAGSGGTRRDRDDPGPDVGATSSAVDREESPAGFGGTGRVRDESAALVRTESPVAHDESTGSFGSASPVAAERQDTPVSYGEAPVRTRSSEGPGESAPPPAGPDSHES